MTDKKLKFNIKTVHLSYPWLAIGTILHVFANWKWIIPVAAWLYLIFLLRFVRVQKPIKGLLLTAIIIIFIYIISFSTLPASWAMRALGGVSYGIIWILPFLADRLISIRFKGILSTLVFPLGWVTIYWRKVRRRQSDSFQSVRENCMEIHEA